MLILISPAKTLNFDVVSPTEKYSTPEFLTEAAKLVEVLRKYSPARLQKLMKINPKIADLNATRYSNWHLPFHPENAKQALLVFKGEVFNGLKAETLNAEELDYAQEHLRILSGLYGVLKPLDLMQPYRLEMGTKITVNRKSDLYAFWGQKILKEINNTLEASNIKYLINLASNEYFKTIKPAKLKAEIITPVFKDYSNGKYKFLTVYGKKARGMMARYIVKNRIEDVEHLKLFDEEGYLYNAPLSEGNNWVFTRG